eukprot:scaffold42699_cov33-Tisochrysis_lutea.AAC.3
MQKGGSVNVERQPRRRRAGERRRRRSAPLAPGRERESSAGRRGESERRERNVSVHVKSSAPSKLRLFLEAAAR